VTLAGHTLTWGRVAAYAAVARIAVRQALVARGEIVGRTCFYVLLLFIFSRLWQTALADVTLVGSHGRPLTPVDLLWYMAATEWALIAVPHVQNEIERDVRSGDIAYQLARPISYVGVRLAEAAGDLAVRLLALGVTGVIAAYGFSGAWPSEPAGLLLAVPCGIAAGVLALVFQAVIGVCAFWVQDVTPLYWVWQKLAFVLGGLLLPLDLYPEWLRSIAEWTPFTALLYRTGRVAIGGWDPAGALAALAWIAGWLVVATVLLVWVTRRGRRILDVNGG
jgi:ABC-2 type transport system permease protein